MSDPASALDAAGIDAAFPFHLTIDRSGEVVALGPCSESLVGEGVIGRSVEKWSVTDGSDEITSVKMQQSSLELYNYLSPVAFIVSDDWLKKCY